MWTLHHQFHWWKRGLLNFVEVAQALVSLNWTISQARYERNNWNNQNTVGQSELESVRDSGSDRHITYLSSLGFQWSFDSLEMNNHNPQKFLISYRSVDETWIHHNTPEANQRSKQRSPPDESLPIKAKKGLSAKEGINTLFSDARGITHIHYIQKVKMINNRYYKKNWTDSTEVWNKNRIWPRRSFSS